MTTMTGTSIRTKELFIQKRPLFSFFTLAILITWLFSLPSLLFEFPFKPFQTVGAYGPLLAAMIVSAALGGDELRSLFRRMTNFRIGLGWYLLAVFGYILLDLLIGVFVSGGAALASFSQKWPLIFTLYLPVLITSRLINPIGEETGWTGFAAPHVQRKFGPWLGAIVLGVVWGVWHLPAYLVPSEMGAFNPIVFVFILVSQISTRVIWTWIANKTGSSVAIGVLLHASSNTASLDLVPQLFPSAPPEAGLIAIGVTLMIAIATLILTRGRLSYKG